MLERLSIAVALLAFGFCAFRMARVYILWRAAKQAPTDPLLADTRDNIPVVVYFTTPSCMPCKYAQQPALAKLQQELGEAVQVIQVDATQNPEAASRWQVQTVPTTFVLDGNREPKQVNHGVAGYHKLRQQIQVVSA